MRTMRNAVALLCLGVACLMPVQGASAASQPGLAAQPDPTADQLQTGQHGTTSVAPLYRLIATNIGGAATEGPVTLKATIPTGLAPLGPVGDDGDPSSPHPSCSAVGQEVTCTTPGPIYPGRWLGAIVPLKVTAGASEVLTATASVEGGGASAATSYEAEVNAEPPPFGFLDGPAGFPTLLTEADGSAATSLGRAPRPAHLQPRLPDRTGAWRGPRAPATCVRSLPTCPAAWSPTPMPPRSAAPRHSCSKPRRKGARPPRRWAWWR